MSRKKKLPSEHNAVYRAVDRWFCLSQRGSNIKTEIYAGLLMFLEVICMAAVSAQLIADKAYISSYTTVYFGIMLVSTIGTVLVGLLCNAPLIQSLSMGGVTLIVSTLTGYMGLTLADRLRKQGNLLDIIFISNREELIFDALRYNPKGFIRKSRFFQDVEGVIKTYFTYRQEQNTPRTLVVESREQVLYIAVDTLIYIECIGKKQLAHIVGKEEPMELRKQMQQLEEELTPYGFLRIHKGYLVNYRFIRKICESDVILTNDEHLAVSRRRLTEIREKYMELMQSEGALML